MQLGLISRKYAIQLDHDGIFLKGLFWHDDAAKMKKREYNWSENFEKSNGRKKNEFYKLIKWMDNYS